MNPFGIFFRVLHWPLCRAYSRYLGDEKADAILRFLCSLQFLRVNHFWPNFINPQRFSEKIWSLQLHNRDPLLTKISDNFQVREYVTEKIGEDYLIPLHWVGEEPDDIPFDELPSKFVIKTNHGCGFNIFFRDKAKINLRKTKEILRDWISINYCNDVFIGIPWAYRNIKPKIMVESLLEENGKVPTDYKFWCFNGKVEVITLHFDRFENHYVKTLKRNFEPYEHRFPLDDGRAGYKRPDNYKEIVKIAELLAADFPFIRVDLYNVNGKIYFSELTPYPGGVSARFEPERMDYALGKKWEADFSPNPTTSNYEKVILNDK